MVQVWYPTDRRRCDLSPYVPEPWLIDYLKKDSSSPETVESWRNLATHGCLAAPLFDGRFPLVLFSQGMGMSRFNYTAWLEELASRGYVVASIDHPEIAPMRVDGRIVEGGSPSGDPAVPARRAAEMAADMELVVQELLPSVGELHFDAGRIAVVGHSLGGAAALESCRTNPRMRACVDIDGDAWGTVEKEGVGRPFLLILNEPSFTDADFAARGGSREQFAKMGEERRAQWKALMAKQAQSATLVLVKGTNHLSFTDAPFVRPVLVNDHAGTLTDPERVLKATTDLISRYLQNAFAGRPSLIDRKDDIVTILPLRDWSKPPV